MDINSYKNITVNEREPWFQFTRVHLAAAGVVALAALIAGAIYAYLFLWPYAKADHDAYLAPDTALRFVFEPARAQRYVSRLAPSATRFIKGIPQLTSTQGGAIRIDWIHTLPREATLLFSPASEEEIATVLVVRPHPEAYDFAGLINDSSLFGDLRFAQWSPRNVVKQADGALVAHGVARIPVPVQQALAGAGHAYAPIEPPVLDGNHLFELAADNRNDILTEIHGVLTAVYGGFGGPEIDGVLNETLPMVAACSLKADLEADDRIVFSLDVTSRSDAGTDTLERALADLARAVAAFLEGQGRFRFEQTGLERIGGVLHGAYLFTGFEPALARALGG